MTAELIKVFGAENEKSDFSYIGITKGSRRA